MVRLVVFDFRYWRVRVEGLVCLSHVVDSQGSSVVGK